MTTPRLMKILIRYYEYVVVEIFHHSIAIKYSQEHKLDTKKDFHFQNIADVMDVFVLTR